MPDVDLVRFSDMKESHPIELNSANDLIAIAHPDQQSSTGYVTMTTTPRQLSEHTVKEVNFLDLKTSTKNVQGAINQTISNFADDYSSSSTYAVGDCVLHAGGIYQCNTAIETAEEWTPAHWTQVKAVDVGSGGGGSSTLAGLTDVELTTPQDGEALIYDGNSDKWINGTGGGKQQEVTQAQYDALVQAGTVDPTVEYFISDGIPYSIAPWTDLTATLTAGQTSLVFSNAVITTNSTIEVFVNDAFYGVNPTAITLATGSVTLTFSAQSANMPVKVRVS